MRYVVDTDVMIDVQRGHPAAVAWFADQEDLPFIPGFVVMELVQGAENARQVRQVLKLVEPLTMIWPSETDCARALADFTTYHLSHRLGLLDALIAACAIAWSASLCTLNTKHYRVIPGLQLHRPYTR